MINIFGNIQDKWDEKGIEIINANIKINSCGYQKFITKDFKINRARGRNDFQIIYLVQGYGHYIFGDKTIKIGKGNIIVYFKDQPQSYYYKAEDKTELYWIHMSGKELENLMKIAGFDKTSVYFVGTQGHYEDLFKKIIKELQVKNIAYESFSSSYFLELLAHFNRNYKMIENQNNRILSEDIRSIIEFMQENYNKDYTEKFYSDRCNLALYSFIHKFKKETGTTPINYIINIRINYAKELLSNTTLNINEVAQLVGYSNPLYFSRVFKKYTDYSPSYYRKII